jgi:hypothetical protein
MTKLMVSSHFEGQKAEKPRAKLARGSYSPGRLAVFNVEQVTLNRHVRKKLKDQKAKKPALNSAGSLISLAV